MTTPRTGDDALRELVTEAINRAPIENADSCMGEVRIQADAALAAVESAGWLHDPAILKRIEDEKYGIGHVQGWLDREANAGSVPVAHPVTLRAFSGGDCPNCGDDFMGLGYASGEWADGTALKCAGCGMPGWVTCDEEGAQASWNDEDIPPAPGEAAAPVAPQDAIIERMRAIARIHGWALAVHGSLVRDLDLIAVPWVEDAAPWRTVYDDWMTNLPLKECEGEHRHAQPPRRPHHRRSMLILQAGTVRVEDGNPKGTWNPPALDVSFMPRAQDIAARIIPDTGLGLHKEVEAAEAAIEALTRLSAAQDRLIAAQARALKVAELRQLELFNQLRVKA